MQSPSSSLQAFEEKKEEFHTYYRQANRIVVVFKSRNPSIVFQPNMKTVNIYINDTYWNPAIAVKAANALGCIRKQSGGLSFSLSIIFGLLGAILSGINFISSLGTTGKLIASVLVSIIAAIALWEALTWCKRKGVPLYFKEPLLEELVTKAATILRECERGGKCRGTTTIGDDSMVYRARIWRFKLLKPRVEFSKMKFVAFMAKFKVEEKGLS
ncbi:MAG: hypothetical protein GXO68_02055 [Crenarchaeota archaeon]|nr:hypothetical protein [Thermoproteota archaeon]